MSKGRLNGRIAIVTGGASGIGLAVSEAFVRENAHVVIADIDGEGAERAASKLGKQGWSVESIRVDVSDADSVEHLAAKLQACHGRVDVLHNNAACTGPDHQSRDGDVLHLQYAAWDATFAVDLTGAMLMCRMLIPMMVNRGGSIINTTSNSGLRGDLSLSAYSAAKAALHQLTRSIATQFGRRGIRCNAISPAHIASPSFLATVPANVRAELEANCLIPRLGTVEDVAHAAVFLASEESSFITGQVLRVDGGALAHLPACTQMATIHAPLSL